MKLLKGKKAIVFDFDGTLVNSMTDFARMASRVMTTHFGFDPAWAKEQYRKTSGLPFPYQLEKIFPGDPRNRDAALAFAQEKKKFYMETPFFAEVPSTLSWLKRHGFHLAVSSNNEEPLLCEKAGRLAPFLDELCGFREGFAKGEAHFAYLKKVMRVTAGEMLFVGDSLNDALVAKEGGIAFIARSGTFTREDFLNQGIALEVVENLSIDANYSFGSWARESTG